MPIFRPSSYSHASKNSHKTKGDTTNMFEWFFPILRGKSCCPTNKAKTKTKKQMVPPIMHGWYPVGGMADAWLMPSGPGRTSQPLWFPPELLWSLQLTESNIGGRFLSSWWSFSSLQCHNHHNCKKISRPLVDRLKGWIVFSSLATSSVSVKCCSQAKLYKSSDHIKSSFWIGTSWVMPLPHFLPFPLQQSEWQTHFLNSAIFKSNLVFWKNVLGQFKWNGLWAGNPC